MSVKSFSSSFLADNTLGRNLIAQRASIQGFIVFDYMDRYPAAIDEMGKWMQEGKIKSRFHIEEDLERCPEHLAKLFKGVNTGKMCVPATSL